MGNNVYTELVLRRIEDFLTDNFVYFKFIPITSMDVE